MTITPDHSIPIPDRPTAAYVPFFADGLTLVTCWTANGEAILKQRATAHLVLSVLAKLQREKRFELTAYVILPDHVHLLLHAAPGKGMASVVETFLHRYGRDYAQVMGIPEALEVWDQRRKVERLADVDAFAAALDMIHYDPVLHGQAERPEAWAFSSYEQWIDRELYKLGWGWRKPARLQGG
jgi:putative transposase